MTRALRRLPARPDARLRLLCLPYAGGAASVFRGWHRSLPSGVEVVAAQYPGREDRLAEPALGEFDRLLDHVDAAWAGDRDRPVALFGHSLGAVLAFELAARWEADGRPVVHLFVSAAIPPHLPSNPMSRFGPDDDLRERVGRAYGGLPAAVAAHPELAELMLRVLAADLAVAGTYRRPRPVRRLRCPVTAFAAESDRLVSPGEVSGWGDGTSDRFTFHLFPGHHMFLRDDPEPVVRIVGQVLREHTDF